MTVLMPVIAMMDVVTVSLDMRAIIVRFALVLMDARTTVCAKRISPASVTQDGQVLIVH